MAELLSTLPVGKDMEQLLNYYLNNMLMSASVRRYATVLKIDELIGLPCIIQDGSTPLMVTSLKGHADIVQTLIEAKAQVDTRQEVRCSYHHKTHCTTHHHTRHCTQVK